MSDYKKTRSKHEISHDVLAAVRERGIATGNDNWKLSARFNSQIGDVIKTARGKFKLVDMVIMQINVCPKCGSRATYHHRIQQTGDNCDNVWSTRKIKSKTGLVSVKQDLCLDCGNVFIIEMYILHKVGKKK